MKHRHIQETAIPDLEAARRYELVRQLKAARCGRAVPIEVLDAAIEPDDNHRARERRRGNRK
jgi:hypothetical protein